MTDTAYINARNYGDDGEGRRKLVDIDWSAWREQLENWLKRGKDSSERAYQSLRKRAQNVDGKRVFEQFKRVAVGTALNTLAPMVGAMAGMALLKMGIGLAGGPVAALAFGIGFGAFSFVRNYNKAKNKYENDCVKAKESGEDEPKFGLNYLWPVVLKGALTAIFAGFGVMQVAEWDLPSAFDMLPNGIDGVGGDNVPSLTGGEEVADNVLNNDASMGSDEALQSDAMGGAGAETDLNDVDGDVADINAVQPISYDVEFGANFELPENPTAVDRMAAMMPDDVSPEVIEALEAARDGHVWGVHNLAYHLSFEHGGLELDEAGKQLVLDLYAEAASEGHQISIDNLATLENMWGMEAEGFDTSATVSLNDSVVDGEVLTDYSADDEISVIDAYVASLADDAPNPYDVIEVSDLPDITEPTVLGEVGQPYDLTANLGASLDGIPEGYTPTPAALGIDDGVTYGSGSFLEEDAIVTASNPSDAFAASTVVENAIAITPSQTVSFFDHEGLIRIASRDGLDLSQDVAFEFIAPNGDSQYTLVTGAQASQILDSDNPGALLQAMVEDSTGRQWAELNAPLQQETQFASLNGGGGERTLTLN
ncbi:MAG: hypothetical protein CMH32_03430 [Micavibrio sp.]|nr:hypothetical protein [Micavibrio sp.]